MCKQIIAMGNRKRIGSIFCLCKNHAYLIRFIFRPNIDPILHLTPITMFFLHILSKINDKFIWGTSKKKRSTMGQKSVKKLFGVSLLDVLTFEVRPRNMARVCTDCLNLPKLSTDLIVSFSVTLHLQGHVAGTKIALYSRIKTLHGWCRVNIRDSPNFLPFFYLFSIFFLNSFKIASKLLLSPPSHHLT
jgi:hypothetical protein